MTTLQNRINYKKALEETLLNFAYEDMTEHGRLLSIKEIMVSLLDSEDFLDTTFLGLFQLKDFCTNNFTRAEKAKDNIYSLNF